MEPLAVHQASVGTAPAGIFAVTQGIPFSSISDIVVNLETGRLSCRDALARLHKNAHTLKERSPDAAVVAQRIISGQQKAFVPRSVANLSANPSGDFQGWQGDRGKSATCFAFADVLSKIARSIFQWSQRLAPHDQEDLLRIVIDHLLPCSGMDPHGVGLVCVELQKFMFCRGMAAKNAEMRKGGPVDWVASLQNLVLEDPGTGSGGVTQNKKIRSKRSSVPAKSKKKSTSPKSPKSVKSTTATKTTKSEVTPKPSSEAFQIPPVPIAKAAQIPPVPVEKTQTKSIISTKPTTKSEDESSSTESSGVDDDSESTGNKDLQPPPLQKKKPNDKATSQNAVNSQSSHENSISATTSEEAMSTPKEASSKLRDMFKRRGSQQTHQSWD